MSNPEKTSIHVSNIHPSLTKEQVEAYFLPFGEIIEVTLTQSDDASDQPAAATSGSGSGSKLAAASAQIEYEEAEDAASAIDNMNDAELYSRILTVTVAKKSQAFEGLGSAVPLWEQEGFIQQYLGQGGEGALSIEGDAMQGLEVERARDTEQQQQQQQQRAQQGLGELPVSVGPIAEIR